ncbi:thiamine pyrophosphate-binding protein [Marinovum sp.]|uniref:thiamine pyrophosphate-binding protein n=1 Tax=Marinovum sp. TaxID=2024839 RepID=UPI003A95C0DF
MPHGGQILVDALNAQGTTRVFCIPGESYLAALDGLYESGIDTVVARQEGGAAMMAEAQGKLTGRPGVCFVTRGPGATNASAGVHVAMQDSTPMVLFIGQVASDQRDREAFQEVDYRAMFAPLAKWVGEIDRTERIPEYVSRAFHVAQSGRPGPVVLALPEDMLSAACEAEIVPAANPPSGRAAESDITAVLDLLAEAERPLILAGGPLWSEEARLALQSFAETAQIPVATSLRCQDYFDNTHPAYAGDMGIAANPALATRLREADVLLCLGARLGEMTTAGYTLVTPPVPAQKLIHVHPDPSEPGHVYYPTLAVAAQAGEVAQQLAAAARPPAQDRRALITEAHSAYLEWQAPEETPGTLHMEQVLVHLRDTLPETAILTNGAGNYCGWLHRYYRWRRYRTQLAPTSGSMGYGLPAAVAAALEHPDRPVICFAGDGCFQMTMQEFGTACDYGARVIVLLVNNGMYGTIRMHQQAHYPGRVSGTRLKNPDFAAWARSYGALGLTVTRDAEFPEAITQALAAETPALIELKTDPRALSTRLILKDL